MNHKEIIKLKDAITALEARVAELEKHSHVPVTFLEDKDGYLKVDKRK